MRKENDKAEEKKGKKIKVNEDKTQYGEFISSYFEWLTLDEQKRNAGKLENLENNKDKEN